jgi:hypothetical protein
MVFIDKIVDSYINKHENFLAEHRLTTLYIAFAVHAQDVD